MSEYVKTLKTELNKNTIMDIELSSLKELYDRLMLSGTQAGVKL